MSLIRASAIPAAGADLVETRGLHALVLARAARHAHETHLEVGLALDRPHLVAFLGLDDARRALLQLRRQAALEGVRRLHQVIVRGDQRVLDRARLGVGEQRPGDRTLDAELDDVDHG
jgi:hypothetical protein